MHEGILCNIAGGRGSSFRELTQCIHESYVLIDLGSRSWCQGQGGVWLTCLPPIACSACFLVELRATRPVMTPPTMDWALLHQSPLKKEPYICILVLWKHYLNWGFLPSNDFNLHQVYMKLPSTDSMHCRQQPGLII